MLARTSGTGAAWALSGALSPLLAAPESRRFPIGACDWSIGRTANATAFARGKEIGLDGLQVSLGTADDDMKLRQPKVQAEFLKASKESGVGVASLAIGALNAIPYKSDPRTIDWVKGSVGAAKAMGCKVVLLAFFGKGDLKDDAAGTTEVVRRLKEVAPEAEKAGVILGIESWLNAEEHADIIERVGSPAVQVYYDVANMEKMGYDIYEEIRWLGKKKLICQVHAKENGFLLGQGKVDFKKVRGALDDIDYSDWLVIESAVPKGADVLESYIANRKFLRSVFPV